MSEQGIRLFAGVIASAQAARSELFRAGCIEVPSTESSQQDIRLARLLVEMEDHVKDRFRKETVRLPMAIEKASERLSNLLHRGPDSSSVTSVGHDQNDKLFVYLSRRGASPFVPEEYEGYKVVIKKIGKIVGGPARPKRRK